MDRSFIALTGIAAALTFAGVWFATAPAAPVTVTAALPAADLSEIDLAPPTRIERPEVPRDAEPRALAETAPRRVAATGSVHHGGCREARAAGATPIRRGDPGYRVEMDGDGDGIACEDYRR